MPKAGFDTGIAFIPMTLNLTLLLRLRCRQIGRMLREGGISLWLLIPVLLFLLTVIVMQETKRSVVNLNGLMLLLLLLTDWQRTDQRFLKLMPHQGYLLRFVEYAILLLALNAYGLILDFKNSFYLLTTLAILAGGLFFTGSRYRSGHRNATWKRNLLGWLSLWQQLVKKITSLLPLPLYEIKSGLRPVFLLFVMIWLGGLFACWYVPALSFVAMTLCFLLLESMIQPEPLSILQHHRSIRQAVHAKAGWNILFLLILLLPHFIISLWRFHDVTGWISVLVSIWILMITGIYTVLLKYSSSQATGAAVVKVIKISLLISFSPLIPLPVYFIHKEYKKVLCRLKPLLK